jgi:hypothetical protein
MMLKVNIYNSAPITIETEIDKNETILEFMNKHKILEPIPNKYKCLIFKNKKINNNDLIVNYIEDNKLNFWFKLRWFLEE